jgi:cob(I)alamin adenosyltransferase
VARASWPASPIDAELSRIQNDLFDIGAQLAAPGKAQFSGADPMRIEELERAIDALESGLSPLTNFILPGGSPAAAHLHVARTVCRRAERLVVGLEEPSATAIVYLNRLSDYLFVAARAANAAHGVADVVWKKR